MEEAEGFKVAIWMEVLQLVGLHGTKSDARYGSRPECAPNVKRSQEGDYW